MDKVQQPMALSPPKSRRKRRSVLIVDDCEDILELGRTLLEMQGFDIFTASSGTEAFEILSQIEEPDLILLDVHMTDMSGPAFFEMLEEKKPQITKHVPIVFLTGADDVPRGKAAGFIRKATDLNTFLQAIQRYLLH